MDTKYIRQQAARLFRRLGVGFLLLLLAGCTLYLDDEDIAGVDRTDQGYVEQQTVTTDKGTVKYKYAQHTIAINDEVASYIPMPVENHGVFYFSDNSQQSLSKGTSVLYACRNSSYYTFKGRVAGKQQSPVAGGAAVDCVLDSVAIMTAPEAIDADSIVTYSLVYFQEDTPEELLPEVGEVLVCSFRDKFPDAFCHKVVDRQKQNGLYMCMCIPVAYEEAFDVLELDMDVPMTFQPGDSLVDAADELAGYMPDLVGPTDDADAARSYDYGQTRGWFDGWEHDIPVGKLVDKSVPETTITATALKVVSGSINFAGGLKVHASAHIMWKLGAEEHTKFSVSLKGSVSAKYLVSLSVGGDFDLPISIPILGEKLDAYVVGAELGVYATPYIHFDKAYKAGFEYNYSITLEMGYEGYKDVGGDVFARLTDSKKEGVEPLKIYSFDDGTHVTMQAGLKIEAGIGIKPGIALAAGVKMFGEFTQDIEPNEYNGNAGKIDAMKTKTMPITIKAIPYAKADVDLIFIAVGGEVNGDPIFGEGKLWIRMFPSVEDFSFYRTYQNPPEYTMGYKVPTWGLLGTLVGIDPSIRIIDKQKNVIETFKLKKKKDTENEYYLNNAKGFNIKENVPYTAQCFMKTTFGDEMIIDEYAFEQHSAEIRVKDVSMMQSCKGSFPKMYWGQEVNFKYRYRMRVTLLMDNVRNIRGWQLQASDVKGTDYGTKTYSDPSKQEMTVDWYVYAKKKEVTLSVYPSLLLQDDEGKPITGYKNFSNNAGKITLTYSADKEQLSPGWGNPDVEP